MPPRRPKPPWYSEEAGFFGRYYLETYRDELPEERTQAEAAFLEKKLALKKGMRVLDLACGHGRHSIELARRGYQVTGQDLNGYFLRKAKRDARRAGVKARWIQKDMREVPFVGEFDAAFNLFTAFGYFDREEDDRKVLHAVAKALKPGGRFVLDVINREGVMRAHQAREWKRLPDGSVLLYERAFDFASSRHSDRQVRIYKDGRREERRTIVRLYTLAEIVAMLRRAGLRFKEAFGGFREEPLGLGSRRCVILAEKPGDRRLRAKPKA